MCLLSFIFSLNRDIWKILILEGNGMPVELFEILKDDAVKVLHSLCQQIWKIHSDHSTGKGQFHSNAKGNTKECSN